MWITDHIYLALGLEIVSLFALKHVDFEETFEIV